MATKKGRTPAEVEADRARYAPILRTAAETVSRSMGVPADLLNSVLMVLAEKESTFNPKAIGDKLKDGTHAEGMFQYIPATSKRLGLDPFDVKASATAAATDAAKAFKRGGVAEIAASHHAGAGGTGRGPVTREYVRDFLGKLSGMGTPAHRYAPDRTQPRGRMNAAAPADPTNPFAAVAPSPLPAEAPVAMLPDSNPFAEAAPDAQALPDGMQGTMFAQDEPAAHEGADPMEQYAAPALTAPKLARLDTNPFGGYDAKRDPTTLKWFESMIENADG